MQRIIIFSVLCASLGLSAQSEPRYYTDSDVRQRIVNFNVYGQPTTMFRRIGSDLNGVQPEVDDRFLSRLNVETGFSADVHLRPLYLGIGVWQTWVNYAHRLSNDEVQSTKARYWSIPMRAGLVTQLSDEVSLEAWPTVTYRRAISFQQSGLNGSGDAPHAPSFWTAGIQVGGNVALTEYLSYSLMGVMDYGFGDLEDGTSNRAYTELPLFVGIRMGLRLSL